MHLSGGHRLLSPVVCEGWKPPCSALPCSALPPAPSGYWCALPQIFVKERSPDGHSRDEMAIAFSGGCCIKTAMLSWQRTKPLHAVRLWPRVLRRCG